MNLAIKGHAVDDADILKVLAIIDTRRNTNNGPSSPRGRPKRTGKSYSDMQALRSPTSPERKAEANGHANGDEGGCGNQDGDGDGYGATVPLPRVEHDEPTRLILRKGKRKPGADGE